MFDQLQLLDTTEADDPFVPDAVEGAAGSLQSYLLFFALLPPPELGRQLAALIASLRSRHGLSKAAMSADRLHITLMQVAGFGDSLTAHDRVVIRAAVAAGPGLACRAFPVVLNRATSLARQSPAAYVLRCDAASDKAISNLRKLLARGLKRNGLPPDMARLAQPHMSMVHGTQHVAEHPIAPVAWTATRVSLVLSHHGLGYHQQVAEWPLGAGPTSRV